MTDPMSRGAGGRSTSWRLVGFGVAAGIALLLAGCTSKATRSALPTSPDGRPAPVTVPAEASPGVTQDAQAPQVTSESGGEPAGETTASTDPTTTTTKPPRRTTTTTEPLVTTGAVVMVANASNVDGAANRLTEKLQIAGFTTQRAVTASGIEPDLANTKVYVKPGSEAVARSVSRFLGDVPISYMPTPISIQGGPINLGSATVVVMLGSDKADK